jgi:hypothetical protein
MSDPKDKSGQVQSRDISSPMTFVIKSSEIATSEKSWEEANIKLP